MNLGRGRGQKRKQMAEINVVPYIDVMLVLLVIFMITAPLLNQGVKVDLPKTKAQALKQKDQEPLVVSLNAQGQYFLNIHAKADQPLSAEILKTEVAAALTQKADATSSVRNVFVKADQSVNYGEVVKLMALLQQAGAPSVGLVTELPNVSEASTKVSVHGNAWRHG